MTTTFLGDLDDGSPKWHAARAGRLGGSEIGAMLNFPDAFDTRDELIAKKSGTSEPKPSSKAMRRGHYAEAYLRLWLAGEKNIHLDDSRYGTYHGDNFAVINPDGITTDGALVEMKCPQMRYSDKWGRAGTDQIPPSYLCQVQWNCGWLGLDYWYLPLHSTKPTRDGSTFDDALYKGQFNKTFFTYLVGEARRFMADLAAYTTDRKAA